MRTPEQEKAISATGRTIVSASAGSGKTFVMIEKLVSLILGDVNLSEILAVTFTEKAASQMREKLKKAILEKLAGDVPLAEKKKLGEKLDYLPQADISTIHAFCSKILKRYFFRLNLPSDFSILAEESEVSSLRTKAMDKLFEEAYAEKDDDFYTLLSVYRKKRSDGFLKDTIFTFYDKVRPIAGYREILTSPLPSFDEVADRVSAFMYESFARKIKPLQDLLDSCISEEKAPTYIRELIEWIENTEGDYATFYEGVKERFPTKPSRNLSEIDKETVERAYAIRGELNKRKERFLKNCADYETEKLHFESASNISRALVKYTLKFDDYYKAEKEARSKLDFSDLEHLSLELLAMDDVREELQKRYRHVFVDEYQDVNPVQEAIVSAISSDEVFLVGDMKQSIYAFRGAKSIYFANKMEEFEEGSLFLKKNFRSAPNILKFVNQIFSVCMRKETGIDYAGTSMMESGASYGENDGRVKLHVLVPDEEEEITERGVYSVEEHFEKKAIEPSPLAKKIESIIHEELGSRMYDLETNSYRPVRYSDIAILVRSRTNLADLVYYLSSKGIPISIPDKTNICEFTEVASLIDWLMLLDNKEQDYPLISAMLSSYGGFSEEELATIRISCDEKNKTGKGKSFREAVRLYEKKGNDLSTRLVFFREKVDKLRALSRVRTAGEILSKIVADSSLELEYLSFPNGKQKVKRVRKLIESASTSVHAFLTAWKTNEKQIMATDPAGENAVQIMTVHASKGLEYPVVILPNVDRGYRFSDADEVLFFEGVPAPRYYNQSEMTRSETLLRFLCRETQRDDTLRDEMNLFYVALTRAKYSLHLIMNHRKEMKQFDEVTCWAELFDPERFDVEEKRGEVLPFTPSVTIMGGEEGDELPILKAMDYVYPYEQETTRPVKSSASVLLGHDEEYYMTPSIYGESDKEKGTIYHRFLELVDFTRPVEEEYVRLASSFSEEEYKRLDLAKLKEILSMPIFKKIRGKELKREQKFLCYLDGVLYQGAIDLLAIGKEISIVDYKFTGKGDQEVVSHYAPQLRLYRDAVAKIMHVEKDRITMTIVNILAGKELPVLDE